MVGRVAWTWLLLHVLTSVPAAGQGVEGEELDSTAAAVDEGPVPAFFDYDCDLVATLGDPVADWDDVYSRTASSYASDADSFKLPAGLQSLVQGPLESKAEEECPLGVLYLLVLAFYENFGNATQVPGKSSQLQTYYRRVQRLLSRFPVYAIALSRWPVFYVLEHFAPEHEPERELHCDEGQGGVTDWVELRQIAQRWADRSGDISQEEADEQGQQLSDRFIQVLRKPSIQQQAQEECLFGFHFVIANQMVAAANRETNHLPPFVRIVDQLLSDVSFIRISASGWPIFTVLTIFADLNKGLWYFKGGDKKYLRGYSDWNLRRDELSPLVPAELDYLSPAWRARVADIVDQLVDLPATEFTRAVRAHAAKLEERNGPMRPIVRGLVDAALAAAAASGSGRRMVYVVLLYGSRWALLLRRFAGRLRQLQVGYPLLVIAIGEAAAAACKELAASAAMSAGLAEPQRVVCWTPGSESQVHRFTSVHALLHLGVDVLYMDMDTFLLRDPTPRILAQAEGYDAAFARHGDADCINIGVFFLRANAKTAVWMSQYLAWYHDHPFEIDQRGLHVFLRLPAERLNIAYCPEDLVEVRGTVLEDVNEIVIGKIGWAGHLSKMLIFHWCHLPLEKKEDEIMAAYDAADASEAHGLALPPALLVASSAPDDSRWAKVLRFRHIMEAYQLDEAPARQTCW